jgi:pyruvate/2-oxoglutarate dehydrogenase complex dihydrolipoamide dehydrogenase (E3) component
VLQTSSGAVTGSHLLVSAGRRAVTGSFEGLGLELTEGGAIKVDDRMRTSVKGVFAAGDVTGRAAFTHAADEMGRVAAANALGRIPMSFKESAVPWVTFTDPEVARVGLTEAQAAERVKGARVVEMPMSEVDRARTEGKTAGFVKVVVGPHPLVRNALGGKVLGATIVAERAGDMLAELVLAVRTGMITGRIAQASHAYPTWGVAVQQTVGQLFDVGGRSPRPAERG